jgi:hypothetical protein
VKGGSRQLINLIPRGLRLVSIQSVNRTSDGYVFDSKVEVVEQFCFLIGGWWLVAGSWWLGVESWEPGG